MPESQLLTVADQMHILSMGFIFASVVQSAISLKWDEAGDEAKWKRSDRICIVLFPAAFLLWSAWLVFRAFR